MINWDLAGSARGQCVHGAVVNDRPLGYGSVSFCDTGTAAPKPFPWGEGAPVRTLGRMRNGDIFHYQLQLVKMVVIISCFHLNQVHSVLRYIAVPHPSRLRRSTFPPGEGVGRSVTPPNPNLSLQEKFCFRRYIHAEFICLCFGGQPLLYSGPV